MKERPTQAQATDTDEVIALAKERFKEAYESERDDWDHFEKVESFLAHDQWPAEIKAARGNRPCLTLDHLNHYVRHVVNAGLMRSRDVRVLPMSGDADQEVGDILAGLIRQILQTSSSKIAYERGLRHSCGKGKGYWRAKVQSVPQSTLEEIVLRPIRDPRMVLIDPNCEYPDARDLQYCFILKKLSARQFKAQYPGEYEKGNMQSWHNIDKNVVLPWIAGDPVVIAEYYYFEEGKLFWAHLTPTTILDSGKHHGDVPPVIRCIGEEYEYQGKERVRGLVSPSAMDAQRAHNYSATAFIESIALAPIAPFVAAAGQTEQYGDEWKDAHRVPRAVLRYDPKAIGGQILPPPQRLMPPDIPQGWQGMMENLINETQLIMGMAQPNALGTGGVPVQSGAGIEAQKDPGDINTYHYHEHWYNAIEQTGRVILAMIPHVYTQEQTVQIVGDDGTPETAVLNPMQPQAVVEQRGRTMMGYEKVLSKSYNHLLGRFDVAISTGPSSASKKSETAALMQTMVQAYPQLMERAGDLVVGAMDLAGADVLAKRLKSFLPPGVADEDDEAMMMQKLQQLSQENEQLKQSVQDMQQMILAEQQKAQAKLIEVQMRAQADMEQEHVKGKMALLDRQLDTESQLQVETMKAHVQLETNTQNNIVKIITEKLKHKSKIDIELLKYFASVAEMPTHQDRMGGYAGVLEQLNNGDPEPMPMLEQDQPKDPGPQEMEVQMVMPSRRSKRKRALRITRPDGSQSVAELLDYDDEDQA